MTSSEILIECRNPQHPKGRVAKIDTFAKVVDKWSGETAWRGRFQEYAQHNAATASHRSLRVRMPDGRVLVRLTCPERSCPRHVVRREAEFSRMLDEINGVVVDLVDLGLPST